jgi:hypothetical protein
MHETQTRVGDELPNSDGPTFAKLMTMAERELGAFISAVTELFGSGQVTGRLSAVARASCKTQEPEILSSRKFPVTSFTSITGLLERAA